MEMRAGDAISDRSLLPFALAVIGGMILAFTFAASIGLGAGTIALVAAGILMLLDHWRRPKRIHGESPAAAFREVDWVTIFFFIGLFVIVGAVTKTGLLDLLGKEMLSLTALILLWGGAILSAIVDNIPLVITLIPMIKSIAPAVGGDAAVLPLWWSLALGACLGGNGTLIGSAANLTVAGIAERRGTPISFWRYNLAAFPLMLVSIAICHVYVLWRLF
jgi:Na+/H+ antiporter NhaD/arsenite permease-like protein